MRSSHLVRLMPHTVPKVAGKGLGATTQLSTISHAELRWRSGSATVVCRVPLMGPFVSARCAYLQVRTNLPAGFGALRMETASIRLSCGMDPFYEEPSAAAQLCRLLSCAPDSYRHACWSMRRPHTPAVTVTATGLQLHDCRPFVYGLAWRDWSMTCIDNFAAKVQPVLCNLQLVTWCSPFLLGKAAS